MFTQAFVVCLSNSVLHDVSCAHLCKYSLKLTYVKVSLIACHPAEGHEDNSPHRCTL